MADFHKPKRMFKLNIQDKYGAVCQKGPLLALVDQLMVNLAIEVYAHILAKSKFSERNE